MTENWVMVGVGVLILLFGLAMTAVSGPMPGSKPLYRPRLRFRLIVISFGVLISALGVVRLIRN